MPTDGKIVEERELEMERVENSQVHIHGQGGRPMNE